MPSSFRRVANELDPSYVPEAARLGRRPVPNYAKKLLSVFGLWWLPRLGLGLVVAGTVVEVAGMILFAAQSWLAGIGVLGAGLVLGVVGSVMWQSYRMRHWLSGGVASAAPLLPPIPRRTWVWMLLAVVLVFIGVGLELWLVAADRSVRAIVAGAAILTICGTTAATVILWQTAKISSSHVGFAGIPTRRLALIVLVIGLILGGSVLAQVPLLPETR